MNNSRELGFTLIFLPLLPRLKHSTVSGVRLHPKVPPMH